MNVHKVGLYRIQSTIHPERCYIGSAINIHARWREHLWMLKNKKHHSQKLQNHCNKYGKEDLQFSVLACCDKKELIQQEQFFIDANHCYFNMCPTAGNVLGRKHSIETKNKIGKSNKGKLKGIKLSQKRIDTIKKNMIGNKINLGRVYSKERNKKIGNAIRGRIKTPEECRKISDSHKKPILQFHKNMNFIKEYLCVADACIQNNWKTPNHIRKCLLHTRISAYKFIWKYKIEYNDSKSA